MMKASFDKLCFSQAVTLYLHAGMKDSSGHGLLLYLQVSSSQELGDTCETWSSLGTLGVSPRKAFSVSKTRQ